MSLNQGAEDDLGNALFDPELVETNPGAAAPNSAPTIIVSDDSKPEDKSKTAEDEALAAQKAIEGDITFKVVTDQTTKAIDLSDLADEFDNKQSISRSDAEMAAVSFESLLSGSVRLNEFTLTPTKTNLAYVQNHMRRTVSLEQARTVDIVGSYVKGPLQALYKQAEAIANAEVYDANGVLYETQAKVEHWLKSKDGGTAFVRVGNTMLPLTREPFENIKPEDIQVTVERKQIIVNMVRACEHFTNGALRVFINYIAADNDCYKFFKTTPSNYPRSHVTMETVLNGLGSPVITQLADAAKKVAEEAMTTIVGITNDYSESSASYKETSDFIAKHGEAINQVNHELHILNEVYGAVMAACPHAVAFVEEMVKPG